MNRLIEKVGDNYKFNADSKKIWQKLFEYEKVGSIEEFKALKKEVELYINLDKTNFSDGYNKAIDEFAEALKNKLVLRYGHATPTEQYVAIQATDWCDEIAEQLKAGGKSDSVYGDNKR